jgi:VanZ family protein
VTWGFLDELHQAFVPSRNADSADLAADAIGAVIGVAIYALIRRMRGANGRPAE